MWDRRRREATGSVLAACGILLCHGASADENSPDAEFLEYLGSWEASDEDWMLFADEEDTEAAGDEASSAAPRVEQDSQEQGNEE